MKNKALENLSLHDLLLREKYFFSFLFLFHFISIVPILPSILTWIDPGWYTYSAFELLTSQPVGTHLDFNNSFLKETDFSTVSYRYGLTNLPVWNYSNYWVYLVFGPSLVASRLISTIALLFLFVSVYLLVYFPTRNRLLARMTTALLALEYSIFWSATSARPDALCATLGYVGALFFLLYYYKKYKVLGLISGLFFSASILTHATGIWIPTALGVGTVFLVVLDNGINIKKLIIQLWPFCLSLAIVSIWLMTDTVVLASYAEDSGLSKSFSEIIYNTATGFYSEIVNKYYAAFSSRYEFLFFLILITAMGWAGINIKRLKQGEKILVFFSFLLLFVVALTDSPHTKPHIVFAMPAFCMLISLWICSLIRKGGNGILIGYTCFALLLGNLLIPRAGKYWQVAQSGDGVSYKKYSEFIQENIPDGSRIISDTAASLMWGLRENGYKLLQSHHLEKKNMSILNRAEYVLLSDDLISTGDYYGKRLPDLFSHKRFTKIAQYGGDCGYCYSAFIYRIDEVDGT